MTSLADASPDQMRQALAAVLATHQSKHSAQYRWDVCSTCSVQGISGWLPAPWPCRTVRAVTDAGIEVPA